MTGSIEADPDVAEEPHDVPEHYIPDPVADDNAQQQQFYE
jgi:hypothetical protein